MGQLFMVNPPKRKKSRKRRTAKQKAATKKMLAARKKSLAGSKPRTQKKGATTMARKRKKRATTTTRRRRRRSTTAKRSPVTTLRRRSVYMTNPRKRRRRRSGGFRRNPAGGIIRQIQQGAMDAGATLVGGAVARIATGLLPLPNTGLTGVASGLAVAVGVGMLSRRMVGADTARFITAGAMQVPIKNLITTFIPQAGAFLGDYDNVGAYQLPNGGGVGDYLQSGGMASYESEPQVEIGSY